MRLRLNKDVINSLIAHAAKGYDMPYKREVGGHLLGVKYEKGFQVCKAVPYRTPFGTRTAWDPNPYLFEKKGCRLETIRFKWIGAYHSHVEIMGTASATQSSEDRRAHYFSQGPVEIVIRVANYPMKWPRNCLSYEENDYVFDICGYAKDSTGRIMSVKVEAARNQKSTR